MRNLGELIWNYPEVDIEDGLSLNSSSALGVIVQSKSLELSLEVREVLLTITKGNGRQRETIFVYMTILYRFPFKKSTPQILCRRKFNLVV